MNDFYYNPPNTHGRTLFVEPRNYSNDRRRLRNYFMISTALHILTFLSLSIASYNFPSHSTNPKSIKPKYEVTALLRPSEHGTKRGVESVLESENGGVSTDGSARRIDNSPDFNPNPLGFNPSVLLGERTESTNPEKSIDDIALDKESSSESLDSRLQRLVLDVKLQKLISSKRDPTELYNHTIKEGGLNRITYFDFLDAYISAYLRQGDNRKLIYSDLERNRQIAGIIYIVIQIEEDGRISFTGYYPHPLLDDPAKKIASNYVALFQKIPKKFVPLKEANLEAPQRFSFAIKNPAYQGNDAEKSDLTPEIYLERKWIPIYGRWTPYKNPLNLRKWD